MAKKQEHQEVAETIARIVLKAGREKPILQGHPWIYSGAIDKMENYTLPGQLADVFSSDGQFLARGYVNEYSQITCRILTREKEAIDREFFRERFQKAFHLRQQWISAYTNAYRLINSEGDFLPGLIVDVYRNGLVCQFLTAGMERQKEVILQLLIEMFEPEFIFERSDTGPRQEEGLQQVKRLLYGKLPKELIITEYGVHFKVDILQGQKTGFYLDQRENRLLVREFSQGKKVLDCFSYSGGFSLFAAKGGAASITAVDSSLRAIELLQENFELNEFPRLPKRFERADVFDFLREDTEEYDLIVLDPPSFARSQKAVKKAARGYKDINMLAFRRLRPGGFLFTFSCSHFIDPKLFQQIVFAAAADVGRPVQILRRLGHGIDHPISIYHPEGEYLKGLLIHVVE